MLVVRPNTTPRLPLHCSLLRLCSQLRSQPCSHLHSQVEEFMLWPVEQVARVVADTKQYKPNCCMVIVDFLIRHGYITPDQPGYLDLVRLLRNEDCR